jgi:hypothetical protein
MARSKGMAMALILSSIRDYGELNQQEKPSTTAA